MNNLSSDVYSIPGPFCDDCEIPKMLADDPRGQLRAEDTANVIRQQSDVRILDYLDPETGIAELIEDAEANDCYPSDAQAVAALACAQRCIIEHTTVE